MSARDPGSDEIEKRDIDAIGGTSTFRSSFIFSFLIVKQSKTRNDRPTTRLPLSRRAPADESRKVNW